MLIIECNKCKRPVEKFEIKTPVEPIPQLDWSLAHQHTGEIIIEVECHGERWRASNWRGVLR